MHLRLPSLFFAGLLSALPAAAEYTFGPFDLLDVSGPQSFELVGAPVDTYDRYRVEFVWTNPRDLSGTVGTPWSSEASFAFFNEPLPPSGNEILFADPGPALGSFDDTVVRSLAWEGTFLENVDTSVNPVHFWYQQLRTDTAADWLTVRITLIPEPGAYAAAAAVAALVLVVLRRRRT